MTPAAAQPMAVLGLGTDIVEIARLRQSIERHGEAFLNHVYSSDELAQAPAEGTARRMEYLAGRWAVKEALAKALGCGISAKCRMQEVVTLDEGDGSSGRPALTLRGAAAETAAAMGVQRCLVSIAHEHEYAVATVLAMG